MTHDHLRPATEADLDQMRAWRNAPGVRAMMYTQHVITPDEHAAWWRGQSARTDCRHLIFCTDEGPQGVVSFSGISAAHGTATWAFYARAGAPKGTGRRMEYAALTHAFDTLGLRKLICEVLTLNPRVIALHKAHGFRVEGVFRAEVVLDGTPRDVIRLALFADRWHAIRATKRQELMP